jgi:hypothetical protein
VHERDPHRVADRIGDLVHRIGAEHQQLGACGHERGRLAGEPLARLPPGSAALEFFDLREVDRSEDAVGGVEGAEAVADDLVDHPVVLGRGLPAHPAEQPNALHAIDGTATAGRASRFARSKCQTSDDFARELVWRYDRAVEPVTDIRSFALGLIVLVIPR